jgi:hypothetical protein
LLRFPFLYDDFDPYHLTSPFVDLLQSSSTAAFLAHISRHYIKETYHLACILGKLQTFQYQPFGGLGFQDFSVWAVASFVIPFMSSN